MHACNEQRWSQFNDTLYMFVPISYPYNVNRESIYVVTFYVIRP